MSVKDRRSSRLVRRAARSATLVVLLLAACAQQESAREATEEGGATTIAVTLQEWSVAPAQSSAPVGEVMFETSNAGGKDHELRVVRTDLDLTQLPTKDDGSFDEEGEGVEVIDAADAGEHGAAEHEVVEPGDEKVYMYELEEGSYVLLCNLVEEVSEDGEESTEVHFKLGMRIPFTVE